MASRKRQDTRKWHHPTNPKYEKPDPFTYNKTTHYPFQPQYHNQGIRYKKNREIAVEREMEWNENSFVNRKMDVIDSYGGALADAGYSIDFATDGKQALALCENVDYDLVLLDIMLPDINGIDLLKEIQQDKKRYGRPLKIVLTAIILEPIVREAYESGADDYLIKSEVSCNGLVVKINNYIEKPRSKN